jgi:hypothetical protein
VTVNVFDQAARYSVQPDPLGFLRWVVPGLDPSLAFHGWLGLRPKRGQNGRLQVDNSRHQALTS